MDIVFLIGRILLGGFFIFSGINHFRGYEGMAGYVESKGLPAGKAAVIGTGVLLTLGGLGVALGVFPQLAILLLLLFLLPTTILMHDFWNADEESKQNEITAFGKNIALIGALLSLLTVAAPWVLSL